MKPSKYEPCRFCGGRNLRTAFDEWTRDCKPKPPFYVLCETCHSRGPEMPTERRAWTAWNKQDFVNALRESVRELLSISRIYARKNPGREILSGYPDTDARIIVPNAAIEKAERLVEPEDSAE